MKSQFHILALDWVRTKEDLHTEALPDDAIAIDDGVSHLDAFLVRGGAAGGWLLAGLWAMLAGSILVMLDLPGFTSVMHAVAERSGWFTLAAGVLFFVVAEIMRRRTRVPAMLELRAEGAGPVTAESLAAFVTMARGAKPWIVAQAGVTPEAMEVIARRGVRCFVPDGDRFREVKPASAPERSAAIHVAVEASVGT